MSDIQVEFVQQQSMHTCVHACLAMVTGIPIESLIERFGDDGLNWAQEATVLVEHKIWPHRTVEAGPHPFPICGVYLATVPSLNLPGRSHRVVIDARSEGYTLYDPNSGREGKEVYESVGIMSGDISLSEVTYLDTSVLCGMRDLVEIKEAA